MTLGFKEIFYHDLQKINGPYLLRGLKLTLKQIEAAENIHDIGNIKRLKTGKSYFGIKLGNHHLGLKIEGNTVILVRLLHTRELLRLYS